MVRSNQIIDRSPRISLASRINWVTTPVCSIQPGWDYTFLICGVYVGIHQKVLCQPVSTNLEKDFAFHPKQEDGVELQSLAFSSFVIQTHSACRHCLASFHLHHTTMMIFHNLSRSLQHCLYTLYGTQLGPGAALVHAALTVSLTSAKVGSLMLN